VLTPEQARRIAVQKLAAAPTIAGLLGHAANGVTQRYVHLDAALVTAADQVSREIALLVDSKKAQVVRRVA